jgi:hypothetical protein
MGRDVPQEIALWGQRRKSRCEESPMRRSDLLVFAADAKIDYAFAWMLMTGESGLLKS